MRKTKIICTIGPASEDHAIMSQLVAKGMNVARLNFSHGEHAEHQSRIETVRRVATQLDVPLAIMLDTKGPEIRTGSLQNKKVNLKAGQKFVLTTREVPGDEYEVGISYHNLPAEVKPGISILLADGLINLEVESITATDIICRVVNGGELGEKKGVNVPAVRINLPFLSDKDIADINFGIDEKVDFIAASFVRSAQDVLDIRRILESRDANIDIIAKIESQAGVDNLDEIIKVADGVMVARGDLGVEIPAEEVPLVQKRIIQECNKAGKVVIIATQMLDSMINNPRPTRAEVSDVANAIFDGADAIMLSGESAAGRYPVEAVETMARVAARAEQALPYHDLLRSKRLQGTSSVTDAISFATCTTVASLGINTIVTSTTTGATARMVSKYRPRADIFAVTANPAVMRKLVMVWGVYPVLTRPAYGTDDILEAALDRCLEKQYIRQGDMVVLTAGSPAGLTGSTNLIKVHVVSDILLRGMGVGSKPASGRSKIVLDETDLARIESGDILVCRAVYPAMVPYLNKVTAIVAEEGGLTSDAAIIGLNTGLPVIVGAQDATRILKEGDLVTIDTAHGLIYSGLAKVL
ncbi:MAG TPA: pyruvate kinase [Syntrophomonadaceae bacterium]|nr:pyruvate kinase [Syntrophomonadaceae bacterium]